MIGSYDILNIFQTERENSHLKIAFQNTIERGQRSMKGTVNFLKITKWYRKANIQ